MNVNLSFKYSKQSTNKTEQITTYRHVVIGILLYINDTFDLPAEIPHVHDDAKYRNGFFLVQMHCV